MFALLQANKKHRNFFIIRIYHCVHRKEELLNSASSTTTYHLSNYNSTSIPTLRTKFDHLPSDHCLSCLPHVHEETTSPHFKDDSSSSNLIERKSWALKNPWFTTSQKYLKKLQDYKKPIVLLALVNLLATSPRLQMQKFTSLSIHLDSRHHVIPTSLLHQGVGHELYLVQVMGSIMILIIFFLVRNYWTLLSISEGNLNLS